MTSADDDRPAPDSEELRASFGAGFPPNFSFDKLEQLCAHVCEESAGESDYQQLNELLVANAAARQFYIRYMNLHAALTLQFAAGPHSAWSSDLSHDTSDVRRRDVTEPAGRFSDAESVPHHLRPTVVANVTSTVGSSTSSEVVVPASHGVRREPTFAHPRRQRMVASFCTAATVIGLLLVALSQFDIKPYSRLGSSQTTAVHVGKITMAQDCVWAHPRKTWRTGQTVDVGSRLELVKGLVEISYTSGATVIVEGPASFECRAASDNFLHLGRLTAIVPQPAHGFRVTTPQMSAVDLGTEFGLHVAETGDVELHVLEGRVRAEFAEGSVAADDAEVLGGSGIRVAHATGRPELIAADESQFVRNIGNRLVTRGPPIRAVLLVPEFSPASALIPSSSDVTSLQGWQLAEFRPSSSWRLGRLGVGYDTKTDTLKPFINLQVTELFEKHGSVLVRIPFEVSIDIAAIKRLDLGMRYDDGFVAYLNGERIAAANASENPALTGLATAARTETLETTQDHFDVSRFIAKLRPGDNMLAIHGLNHQLSSTDLLISPQLTAYVNTDATSSSKDRPIIK